MQGGAMYALERGLNMRWLGLIFAFFGGFCFLWNRMCHTGQCHCNGMQENLHIPPAVIGIAVAWFYCSCYFRWVKSLQRYVNVLFRLWHFFYVIGCIRHPGDQFRFYHSAVKTICKLAFTPGPLQEVLWTWYHDGYAVWNRKRTFFQGIRYGFRAYRRSCSPDKKSGTSGSCFQYRYILGHRCSMSDDRSRSCHQHYEKSFY